ncbi:aspartate kinase [Candidatus Ichthyocystis hellenicum]|uniref:aspartate kinase n=1 Tax=Candidatus Ichthyocystis hellenicum TaxID=1561003 RepID=UPI000A6BBEE1|nr:aspartate kinase [Candidatus Ichthyocystis hellenicum]
MSLLVQKYGGTSLASCQCMKGVASRISDTVASGHDVVVIVSAMAVETERFLGMARQFSDDPDSRELAVLLSCGETMSAALLAGALRELGLNARSYSAFQLGVKGRGHYLNAQVTSIDLGLIRQKMASGEVIVLAGFQAVNDVGDVVTLGRGGSDLSAVALAALLGADECQIYKDVDGVFTANPHVVGGAKLIRHLGVKEVLAMAESGSRVIQLRAAACADRHRVNLRVLSSFSGDTLGTRIYPTSPINPRQWVVGISCFDQQSKWNFQFLSSAEGSFLRFLSHLSAKAISFHASVQNRHSGVVSLFLLVNRAESSLVSAAVDQLLSGVSCSVEVEHNWARLSVIGCDLVSHVDTHNLVLSILLQHKISADVLLMTETQMSFLLPSMEVGRAVDILHETLELSSCGREEEVISGTF